MYTNILIEKLIELLINESQRAEEARARSQADANAHGGAMQSRYDTFKEESQYLASGQQLRNLTIMADVHRLKKLLLDRRHERSIPSREAKPGSTIQVSREGTVRWFILLPGGGGRTVHHEGIDYEVINLNSPLGRELHGKSSGDIIDLHNSRHPVTYEVLNVIE